MPPRASCATSISSYCKAINECRINILTYNCNQCRGFCARKWAEVSDGAYFFSGLSLQQITGSCCGSDGSCADAQNLLSFKVKQLDKARLNLEPKSLVSLTQINQTPTLIKVLKGKWLLTIDFEIQDQAYSVPWSLIPALNPWSAAGEWNRCKNNLHTVYIWAIPHE